MDLTSIIPVAELLGFFLASFGVLRESFADLAEERVFGEGRYGEGEYGGSSKGVLVIVKVGVLVRLLPGDRQLTLTDRRRNAALAISGVLLAGVGLVLAAFL